MEYDTNRHEMLDLLSDIVQSSSIYDNQELDLLNYIEDIREQIRKATWKSAYEVPVIVEKKHYEDHIWRWIKRIGCSRNRITRTAGLWENSREFCA